MHQGTPEYHLIPYATATIALEEAYAFCDGLLWGACALPWQPLRDHPK